MSDTIVVEDYNPEWALQFKQLKDLIWPKISDVAVSIEHIGSTSVSGLAAKPIIDIDIVVYTAAASAQVIQRLALLGYVHRGNLGIEGREAMKRPEGPIKHNLYVCMSSSMAYRNHILLRDYLSEHTDARDKYSALKRRLAKECGTDMDLYCESKTAFITDILSRQGMSEDEVIDIRRANKIKVS